METEILLQQYLQRLQEERAVALSHTGRNTLVAQASGRQKLIEVEFSGLEAEVETGLRVVLF